MSNPKILVAVATYNERDNLPSLVDAIEAALLTADVLVIDDNSPDRLMRNVRAAGVDARVQVSVADMRTLPFAAGRFDAAFSVAAIDHLPWPGIEATLRETARVLRPGGQLLIVSLNSDAWVAVAMPWALHGHGFWSSSQNRRRWRAALDAAGFVVDDIGTRPATQYILASRPRQVASR